MMYASIVAHSIGRTSTLNGLREMQEAAVINRKPKAAASVHAAWPSGCRVRRRCAAQTPVLENRARAGRRCRGRMGDFESAQE